ncbi:uracil DNA glycosylase [Linderina pennispora]|nr:uracil DNA glycosylase [Linderina pennispora]
MQELAGQKRKTLDSFFKPKKPTEKRAKAASPAAEGESRSDESQDPAETAIVRKDYPQELRLEYETIDVSWLKHLEPEFSKKYFTALKAFLKQEEQAKKTIFPPAIDVYSWSRFAPFSKVRVVILGQDPYHGPGQAHGLAFSVRPGVRTPPSLVNMYKGLAVDYPDFVRPSHGYLKGWAEQGVLLLNAALTVECHKANSHANKGWEKFTDAVISTINKHRSHVVFMLWGSYAQKKGAQVNSKKHLVLKSVHPSPLSASRGFFEAGHFKMANKYLRENGQREIDWSCLPEK